MMPIDIDGSSLTLDSINEIAHKEAKLKITANAIARMQNSRDCIDELIGRGNVIYGVNTGFGKLSNILIPRDQLEELQLNLLLSHACGVGDYLPENIVRTAMALKVNSLCRGFSGTRPELANMLVEMLNRSIIPCIPEKGSVGASGDLAPLAHMSLVMLGLGEAFFNNQKLPGKEALKKAKLQPFKLAAKEGLALINGTQVTTAIAAIAFLRAIQLVKIADIAGALTVESLLHSKVAFDDRIQKARGFPCQIQVGQNVRALLADSEIVDFHKDCGKVQDAYSSRCIPQVHGAVRQALEFVQKTVETELNACTDNPLVFYDEKEVLSGGNFHAQPLSIACDTLAIAMAQLANISERRLENLMDQNQSGLPPFLAIESGKNSGYMIAQVTAAALVSENKVLCHPASVDSIPTSANQEDFVSMGTHAARKALEVVENAETIIGIELLAGCQALDFRKNLKPGKGTGPAYKTIRRHIPSMTKDRLLQKDISQIRYLIRSGDIVRAVEKTIGPL
jgi:histidine ammonia-lyase